MGSGGLVIMDERTCMVDLARYFLTFTADESCGQCTPCREGTGRMLEILERICRGEGARATSRRSSGWDGSSRGHVAVRAGPDGAQPRAHDAALLPRGVRGAHPASATAGRAHARALVPAPCTGAVPGRRRGAPLRPGVSQGNFEEAYLVVREKLPLPSVCGVVCFHPCERVVPARRARRTDRDPRAQERQRSSSERRRKRRCRRRRGGRRGSPWRWSGPARPG